MLKRETSVKTLRWDRLYSSSWALAIQYSRSGDTIMSAQEGSLSLSIDKSVLPIEMALSTSLIV
jgi:hypothetical protein